MDDAYFNEGGGHTRVFFQRKVDLVFGKPKDFSKNDNLACHPFKSIQDSKESGDKVLEGEVALEFVGIAKSQNIIKVFLHTIKIGNGHRGGIKSQIVEFLNLVQNGESNTRV
ncbi:hypothetical protein O6H91_10G018900 [Diphasiastrum complanatum]|uniref:Uncharacterized protein n=1 Tax=Diphasiastrum complanatum TaxID=34168 RepID=A0ACC2CEM8_DIPCM|nr:hypothetical protein O6H91_10G018900 [Diphasiastrum complanatum]